MTMAPMLPRERGDFSAIVDRPPLRLPGGARLVVWTIVNFEVWDIERPMARQVLPAPTGQALLPDVPNWSWHEYGMRVGVWRFFELFARRGLRPTLAVNARVCEDYPRVAEEARRAGWEFMGHGYDQMPMHLLDGSSRDHPALRSRSWSASAARRPVGWLGPGLTQTLETPDLLAAAGIKYIGDWVYDDEPTTIRTAERPAGHAALFGRAQRHPDDDRPASRERLSASSARSISSTGSTPRAQQRAKIMALAIHPYISGQPHRIKYLDAIYEHVGRFEGVLHWNGAEILDWYLSQASSG